LAAINNKEDILKYLDSAISLQVKCVRGSCAIYIFYVVFAFKYFIITRKPPMPKRQKLNRRRQKRRPKKELRIFR
jgi:hypothetical protein